MIFDRIENWRKYFSGPAWSRAFEYIESLGPDSPDADLVPLQGEDIYARIMSYPTCRPDEAKLEAHDRYIDIQTSLVNCEGIDWFPRASLKIDVPYDPKKERVLFKRPNIVPARINNWPGMFSVFFPEDAHMPKLIVGGKPQFVKKAVVKVRVDLVRPETVS